jgi:hypothetical protein
VQRWEAAVENGGRNSEGIVRGGVYLQFLEKGSTAAEEGFRKFDEIVRGSGDGQVFEPAKMRDRQKECVVEKEGASLIPGQISKEDVFERSS